MDADSLQARFVAAVGLPDDHPDIRQVMGDVYAWLTSEVAKTNNMAWSENEVLLAAEKIQRARHLYDPSRPLRPWMAAILRNCYRDQWRRQQRQKQRAQDAGGASHRRGQALQDADRVRLQEDEFARRQYANGLLAARAFDCESGRRIVCIAALWALEMRVRMLRMGGQSDEQMLVALGHAAGICPWQENEGAWHVRSQVHPNGTTWRRLALPEMRGAIRISWRAAACLALSSKDRTVERNTYEAWVSRYVKKVEKQLWAAASQGMTA